MKLKQFLEVYNGEDELCITNMADPDTEAPDYVIFKSDLVSDDAYRHLLDLNVVSIVINFYSLHIVLDKFNYDVFTNDNKSVALSSILALCGWHSDPLRRYLFCVYKNEWDPNAPLGQMTNKSIRDVYFNYKVLEVRFDKSTERVFVRIEVEDNK